MKKVLISGSIAYDHLMTFEGELHESFLADEMKDLSLSFLANKHDIAFGGCAANVAYTLKLLGIEPYVFALAGNDFEKYREHLENLKISTEYIEIDPDKPTGAAYILTDTAQSQLTIFAPGAMQNLDRALNFSNVSFQQFDMVVISPGVPHRMFTLMQHCIEHNLPFIFDPGQEIPVLSKEALITAIEHSVGTVVNNYEAALIEKKTGQSIETLAKRSKFIVKTQEDKGCVLYTREFDKTIPAISDLNIVDSTGCGDAFRAGLVYGIFSGASLERSCEMANTAASFVIEFTGAQNHHFTSEEFLSRLTLHYGEE